MMKAYFVVLTTFAVECSAQSYAQRASASLLTPKESVLNTTLESIFPDNRITPRILSDALGPLEAWTARNSYVYRNGTELMLNGVRWTASGANVYWLGLDENVHPSDGEPFYAPFNASYPTHGRITEAMNLLNTLGARTIRSQTLGVSVGNPLSLMPKLGQINEQAFATIDWSIYQAREHGLRIIMPLVDNYDYYHGGKFTFLKWRGIDVNTTAGYSKLTPDVQQFYLNRTVIKDFKNYIQNLITHVNPYTGLSYAADPTVFAFETGNELGGPLFGDMDVPNSWTEEIAGFLKQLAPKKLVVDGTYGINQTHLSLENVDIYSDHFYPLNSTRLLDGIDKVRAANKTYITGEYDWTDVKPLEPPAPVSLAAFYSVIETQQELSKPTIVGDLFWSLFGHNAPNCNQFVNHSDGYALQYGNPQNTPHNNTQISTIRQHFFRMRGVMDVGSYLPAVACPGPLAEYASV